MHTWQVSAPVARVLLSRGLEPQHLATALTLTPNPALREAARRIVGAIGAGQRIRIHGDYDADGVTATATLVLGLREVGAKVEGFIPHRLNEGYGIHPDRVPDHIEACDLLVTVDCGVTNLQEVAAMLQAGTQVIVTDHHAPGPDFPDCLVVHPHLSADYDDALHNLTGAGVAYHLLWAVYDELQLPPPTQYTALAALGTIADVAPLLGENRALVRAGLAEMSHTPLVGLGALLKLRQLTQPTARDVAFLLAPLINAAGRMGEADLALELLTTNQPHHAAALTSLLETHNKERQTIQEQMFKEALGIVDPTAPAIVVTKEDWHAGIMGIVASKLVETFYKPVFIVAQGKGSVRSTDGISAVGGLRYSADLLKRFGGHVGAAGFALDEANYPALVSRLHDYARQFPPPVPQQRLDAPLPVGWATQELLAELAQFEPFGTGHEAPLWYLRQELSQTRLVGKAGDTLQFRLGTLRGVKYRFPDVSQGERDIATQLQVNTWRDQVNVEWLAQGIRQPQPVLLSGACAQAEAQFQRLDPTAPEITARLAAGAYAYGAPNIIAHLAKAVPNVRQLTDDATPDAEIILFSLPPADSLRRWAAGTVYFAFGKHTLAQLEDVGIPTDAQAQAAAYHRYQWAQLYRVLDDAGWAQAVADLLGLEDTTRYSAGRT